MITISKYEIYLIQAISLRGNTDCTQLKQSSKQKLLKKAKFGLRRIDENKQKNKIRRDFPFSLVVRPAARPLYHLPKSALLDVNNRREMYTACKKHATQHNNSNTTTKEEKRREEKEKR